MYFHLSVSKMFTAQVGRGLIFFTAAPYYFKIAGCFFSIYFLRLLILLLSVVFIYKEICGLLSVSNIYMAAIFVGTVGG
jgi:hypothetical protein